MATPFHAASHAIPRISAGALVWGNHVLELQRFTAPHPGRWIAILFENEPVLCLLAGLGLLLAVLGRHRERSKSTERAALALCAHGLLYALVLTSYFESEDRYLLPLLPLTAVLAAHGAQRLGTSLLRYLPKSLPRMPAAWIGALLVLAPSLAAKIHLALLRTRPDTLELAADWIAERATEEQAVGIATFSQLPMALAARASQIPTEPAILINSLPWYRYLLERTPRAGDAQQKLNVLEFWRFEHEQDVRDALARMPCRFVVLELTQRARSASGSFTQGSLAMRKVLHEQGRVVQTFSGGPGKTHPGLFLDFGGGRNQWLEFWRTDNLGPRLQIFYLQAPKGRAKQARNTHK